MSYPEFPDFQPLGIEDKERYEKLTATYPQYSDISFNTLQIWWNFNDNLEFSKLNNNLVLRYEVPFDAKNSGLCLVGTNDTNGNISLLLKHLMDSGEESRLVHVPEFTTSSISGDSVSIVEEVDYNEYIIDAKMLATLGGPEMGRIRRKVNRFIREVDGSKLDLAELTTESEGERQRILDCVTSWSTLNNSHNDPDNTELTALKKTVSLSGVLKIGNTALSVDGELYGFAFFSVTSDRQYLIIHHLKANYSIPFIFDYLTHILAKRAIEMGIPYINMEMDLGNEGLRRHKMALRPVNLIRKYTVRPIIVPDSAHKQEQNKSHVG